MGVRIRNWWSHHTQGRLFQLRRHLSAPEMGRRR